jgi:hypothetical protein
MPRPDPEGGPSRCRKRGVNRCATPRFLRYYTEYAARQRDHIKEAEAESDISLALVVDAELFRLDAVVRWLDAADGRIKRDAARPAGPQATPATGTTTGATPAAPRVRRGMGARR